jgi:cytochrome c biogenesis protein CcmG, thiol:disulfide interchange protein DsbE
MPRRILLPLAAFVVLAAACTSNGPGPTPPPSFVPGESPGATNATTAPLLPTSRYDLPTYSAEQFDQLLGQLKGTPVVVNFWASWCGPCREEAPALGKVAREFAKDVQFVGVDLNDRTEDALVTIRDFAYPYPSIADPHFAIRNSFGFFAQPVTVFFDRNGDRVDVVDGNGNRVPQYSGPIPRDVLHSTVEQLAAG